MEKKSDIILIRSSHNLEEIFSFLEQRIKLDIIIYNKEFQKMLGVNIEDYKKISGKYKVGEKNGKGKEYTIKEDKLVFEGEYLNGKKNGKGKEYEVKTNKLIFEGEYCKGKKNGKGKEFNDDGKLKFEGIFLNGKRNREGKEYYDNEK